MGRLLDAPRPTPAARRGVLAVWVFVAAVIIGLGTASLLIIRSIQADATPAFLAAVPDERPRIERPEEPALHLAGSGTNLPLTRVLAAAYVELYPESPVVVHPSIGSSGGVAAVRDGAIDLAVVSRPLKPREISGGFEAIPYAMDAVVFAAHPTVPISDVQATDVLALYSGERRTWSDGSKVVVLQRERGDSNHRAAHQLIDGLAQVDESAWDEHRWRVLYHDKGMQDALVSTPGAIGLFDQGAAVVQDLPLKVLSFDGVKPGEMSVLAGDYPLVKTLSFVLPPERELSDAQQGKIDRFLRFVASDDGIHLIRTSGYIPLGKDGEPIDE